LLNKEESLEEVFRESYYNTEDQEVKSEEVEINGV